MKTILVTGAGGLIGSEAANYFMSQGHTVVGIDNNMRETFFGPGGNIESSILRLHMQYGDLFQPGTEDIRDKVALEAIFKDVQFDAIIHCAAQPSHDKAASIPLLDFEVNALGTINLLELTRQHSPKAAFVHVSTNKVYGDRPNQLPIMEHFSRYDYSSPMYDVKENMSIDQCTHSLFGASKASADLIAQEYGRYFGMNVGVFRGGCLTGPSHAGVELHGFLNYIIRCAVNGDPYTIYGYKGKQVRDQIHSYDVIRAFEEFINAPRQGEVYNLGGGRENSASILEIISMLDARGLKLQTTYSEQNRIGDHICYVTDMSKFKAHYPNWKLTKSLSVIIDEIIVRLRQLKG